MPDAITVWLTDADAYDDAALAGLSAWLGVDERARSARFVRPLRRRQFILGRALLRTALGELLAIDPHAIMLQERPGNAPLLVAPRDAACFSIAHSGKWVACAVRRDVAIGLDIEIIDESRPVLDLAERAFGDAVAYSLHAMPDTQRITAFYAMWCAHEAQIKLGAAPAASMALAHPELAIALCSAAAIDTAPLLRTVLVSPN